jgi:hypothetical protein
MGSSFERNGQFRTPRHIIRMLVQMVAPRPRERIGDLAAGTGGFLVNAYQYILESYTSPEILEYDAEGIREVLSWFSPRCTHRKVSCLSRSNAFHLFFDDPQSVASNPPQSPQGALHSVQRDNPGACS